MKLKFLLISLIVIILSVPALCFSKLPDPDNWGQYGENAYYNKTNITKSSDTASVWTYTTVTSDIREKTIAIKKEEDPEKAAKYQNFDHIVMRTEIDCKYKVWKQDDITFYDNNDNILDEQKDIETQWGSIIPNSLIDRLYDKVCTFKGDLPPTPEKQIVQAAEPAPAPTSAPAKSSGIALEPTSASAKHPVESAEPPAAHGRQLGAAWEYLTDNVYYNKKNIKKSSGMISVWTYNIVTDEFREQKIETIKKYDMEKARKYEFYDHNDVLSEINCRKKLIRTKMYVDYEDNGGELFSYTYKSRDWKNITPGSLGEKLYQKLCAPGKTPGKRPGKHH
ncbi:MAG TPA: surface-adhesin E family protein [Smithella sp.]|nr:surface-adhesin E family protein [Smithella sp.]